MDYTHPNYYFDLSSFDHQELFEGSSPVWMALSKISSYLAAFQLGQIDVDVPQGVHLVDPELISIGEGSVLEPGAYIKGPCLIGKNCSVRHGAYIRGNLIAGNGCVLGHDSEFKNTILLNDACAAHFAYLGDTILGNHVNLGAGTVCANLRLNREPITLFFKEERYETGLKKLGAILGDEVQTGCHAVLNPGTLMGKRAQCYPCMNIGGFIPSDQVVRPKNKEWM